MLYSPTSKASNWYLPFTSLLTEFIPIRITASAIGVPSFVITVPDNGTSFEYFSSTICPWRSAANTHSSSIAFIPLYFTSAKEIDVAPFVFTPNLPFPEVFSESEIKPWLVTLLVVPLTVTDKVSRLNDTDICKSSPSTTSGRPGIFG